MTDATEPGEGDHWDELRDRGIDVDMGECDLCKTFEAERVETVENPHTGNLLTVSLCEDCWQKSVESQYDESISFDEEMRLREKNGDE